MWSRRLLLACALAAGCGFAPAYGPGGPAEGLRGQIALAPPEDPASYALVRRLEERLGRPVAPRFQLEYRLDTGTEAVRVTREEVAVRYNVAGRLTYRLSDLAGGMLLREGVVSGFTGYSAGAATVAERTAARDARERLMVILADRLVAELLATAEEWRR